MYGVSFNTSVNEMKNYLSISNIDIPFIVMRTRNMEKYGLSKKSPYIIMHDNGRVEYIHSLKSDPDSIKKLVDKIKEEIRQS